LQRGAKGEENEKGSKSNITHKSVNIPPVEILERICLGKQGGETQEEKST